MTWQVLGAVWGYQLTKYFKALIALLCIIIATINQTAHAGELSTNGIVLCMDWICTLSTCILESNMSSSYVWHFSHSQKAWQKQLRLSTVVCWAKSRWNAVTRGLDSLDERAVRERRGKEGAGSPLENESGNWILSSENSWRNLTENDKRGVDAPASRPDLNWPKRFLVHPVLIVVVMVVVVEEMVGEELVWSRRECCAWATRGAEEDGDDGGRECTLVLRPPRVQNVNAPSHQNRTWVSLRLQSTRSDTRRKREEEWKEEKQQHQQPWPQPPQHHQQQQQQKQRLPRILFPFFTLRSSELLREPNGTPLLTGLPRLTYAHPSWGKIGSTTGSTRVEEGKCEFSLSSLTSEVGSIQNGGHFPAQHHPNGEVAFILHCLSDQTKESAQRKCLPQTTL